MAHNGDYEATYWAAAGPAERGRGRDDEDSGDTAAFLRQLDRDNGERGEPSRGSSPQRAESSGGRFDWMGAMSEMQIREFLVTLNANASGPEGVLRDRLARALRRATERNVVWTSDDQPFSDRELMGAIDRGNITVRVPVGPSLGSMAVTTTTVTTSQAGRVVNTTISTPARLPRRLEEFGTGVTGVAEDCPRPLPSVRARRVSCGVTFPPSAHSTVMPAPRRSYSPIRERVPSPRRRTGYSWAGEAHYQPAMYERVAKWNLKFTGHGSGSVETFLHRLDECRETCGLGDADVLSIMPLLLGGIAKIWWGHRKSEVNGYEQFCEELRGRFGEPEVGCRILGEVVTRVQGPLEAGLDYMDSILLMWTRVEEPLPLQLRLNFAFNGLRPEYHSSFRREDFASFEQLYELVRDYDGPRRRGQSRAPLSPDQSVMPELAYHPERYEEKNNRRAGLARVAAVEAGGNAERSPSGPAGSSRQKGRSSGSTGEVRGTGRLQGRDALSSGRTFERARAEGRWSDLRGRCFNCGENGHWQSGCPRPRRPRDCWTCGVERPGTKQGCPGCESWRHYPRQAQGNAPGNRQ